MSKTTTALKLPISLFCLFAIMLSTRAIAGGGPYLVINGYDSIYVNQGDSYSDSGATAHDSSGAIIPGATVSTTQSPKFNKLVPGTYHFTYNYTDVKGKKATPVTRYVIVNKDKVPPVIVLNGSTNMTILVGSTFTDPGVASAYDQLDGDVSGTLVVSNPVNTSVKGDYTIAYSDSDASGNKDTARRYVHVLNNIYSISGNIVVSGSTPFKRHAMVYLIQYDSTDSTLTAIKTQSLNNGNTFSFGSLASGNYLVKAALDSGDSSHASFLPTYYGDVITWSSATNIHLTASSSITINMVSGTNTSGPGFISGKVSQGANKVGDPYPGLLIILSTKAGKAVAYTYSDASGNFSFKNLAYGQYMLSGEDAGKKIISGAITLDAQNPEQSKVSVSVNSTSIVTTVEKNTSGFISPVKSISNTMVYPNPGNGLIHIRTDGQNKLRELQLYNASGQLVQSTVCGGLINTEMNVEKLPAGIYFIHMAYTTGSAERMIISVVH